MSLGSHSDFIASLRAEAPRERTFRVLDPTGSENSVHAISISLMDNTVGGSSAEKTGWVVDVRYENAPDSVLYSETFPTQDLAQKVADDLANVAAECEGLIKQEKFPEAQAKTQELLQKFKANTGETPIQEKEQL